MGDEQHAQRDTCHSRNTELQCSLRSVRGTGPSGTSHGGCNLEETSLKSELYVEECVKVFPTRSLALSALVSILEQAPT